LTRAERKHLSRVARMANMEQHEQLRKYNRWRRGRNCGSAEDCQKTYRGASRLNEELDVADLMRYYPAWVCAKCGTQYGRKAAGLATWHPGTCGVCLADAAVTEPRDFGHLKPGWREQYEQEASNAQGKPTAANKPNEG
jgi:hypothetical protein